MVFQERERERVEREIQMDAKGINIVMKLK